MLDDAVDVLGYNSAVCPPNVDALRLFNEFALKRNHAAPPKLAL